MKNRFWHEREESELVKLYNKYGKHYPSIRNQMCKIFGQKDKYAQSKIYGWITKSIREGYTAVLKYFQKNGVFPQTIKKAKRFTKTSLGNRILSLQNEVFHCGKVNILAMAEAKRRGRAYELTPEQLVQLSQMMDYLTSDSYNGNVKLDRMKRRIKCSDDQDSSLIEINDVDQQEQQEQEQDSKEEISLQKNNQPDNQERKNQNGNVHKFKISTKSPNFPNYNNPFFDIENQLVYKSAKELQCDFHNKSCMVCESKCQNYAPICFQSGCRCRQIQHKNCSFTTTINLIQKILQKKNRLKKQVTGVIDQIIANYEEIQERIEQQKAALNIWKQNYGLTAQEINLLDVIEKNKNTDFTGSLVHQVKFNSQMFKKLQIRGSKMREFWLSEKVRIDDSFEKINEFFNLKKFEPVVKRLKQQHIEQQSEFNTPRINSFSTSNPYSMNIVQAVKNNVDIIDKNVQTAEKSFNKYQIVNQHNANASKIGFQSQNEHLGLSANTQKQKYKEQSTDLSTGYKKNIKSFQPVINGGQVKFQEVMVIQGAGKNIRKECFRQVARQINKTD